jgi:hypothetical protein
LVAGVVLLTCGVLAFVVAGFAVMGDPFPLSRAGVAAERDGFMVVNGVCPGERVLEVTLARQTASGPYIELWGVAGDAALPERLSFGSTPPGMRTVTALSEPLSPHEALSLIVVTSELDSPYSMDFVLDEVPSTGVLSFGEVYPTFDAFARAAVADTPCGDPYSKNGAERFAVVAMLFGAGVGVVGVTLLLLAHRSRVRSAG